MSDVDNTADIQTETIENAPEVSTTTETQDQAPESNLDDELSKVWAKNNPDRADDGKFASRDQKPEGETSLEEGKPKNTEIETAKPPSIEAPNSLPSELKAQWASVPPAMQEHIAKREAESHRRITLLGEQAKAYEPFGKLVETNRDVFQNPRRNVDPTQGIAQLLEAQRQLDRDPIASIAHIAKVYGVDLSMFANPSGETGNQSPAMASLQAHNQHLEAKVSQLEQLVMTREQREQQVEQSALENTISDFLNNNPFDDDLLPGVINHINALKISSPELSKKEIIQKAYEAALWTDPNRRQQLIAKERAAEDARKAEEAKKQAASAKRSAGVNVKSSPGSNRSGVSLDDELEEVWRRNNASV